MQDEISFNQLFLLKKEIDDLISNSTKYKPCGSDKEILNLHNLKVTAKFLDYLLMKGYDQSLKRYQQNNLMLIKEARLKRIIENTGTE